MRKNGWTALFCGLFLLICLIPAVFTVILGPGEAASNEVLAKKPKLQRNGTFNFDVLSDSTAYFDSRFAFRQELITANAALTAAVFRESASDEVLLGQDGWLYYRDTLRDFEGSDPMTARQLWGAAHTLALIREYAESQGAHFLFTVAPNKNTLYPEYMPGQYERGAGPSDLERLTELLSEEDVPCCDLVSALSNSDEILYYQTDSHWTGYGSALAHDALMQQLQRPERLADEEFRLEPHRGDLYEMLCPAGNDLEYGAVLTREREYSYVGTVRGADDMRIETEAADGTGSLLMFRDSFGNTLHADLAEDFAHAVFSRAMPIDLSLMEDDTDTLLIEIVERNLPRLSVNAPIMPAPVRTALPKTETGKGTVSLERASCQLDGLVCWKGALEDAVPDWNSPVFVLMDGTAYEASPVGEAENGFTLYAPEAASVSVYVRCGGIWMKYEA